MNQTIARPAEVIAPVQTPDTLVVTVLPRHIAAGQPGSNWNCAVAQAVREHRCQYASVGLTVRLCNDTGPDAFFAITPELLEWIGRFDCGEPVEPERFVLHAIR